MDTARALEVSGVTHSFGQERVLRGVTFNVRAGTATAVLGRSGCGKTTLLKVIAGLLQPRAGKVRIAGKDASLTPTNERSLGFVFQNLALFPHLTVRRNIEFPFRHGRRKLADWTTAVNDILRRTRLLPAAEKRIDELSGGMKQRVAIARALVYRPSVLLLDEPLSSLDNPLKRELLELLTELKKSGEHTFVYVTHDDREVRQIADDLVVLDEGRVLRSGTLSEVVASPGSPVVAELLRADYGEGDDA